MTRRTIAASALVGVLAIPTLAAAQPQLTLDWPAMADRLVTQLALEPGERVLLVAAPGMFDDLIPPPALRRDAGGRCRHRRHRRVEGAVSRALGHPGVECGRGARARGASVDAG